MKTSRSKPAARAGDGGRNAVRIIGGRWRGRRVTFPDSVGLRPTPDRVRETLFNWLQPVLLDARCLDLFAGSGVLGFEALSRGASECVFIDRERGICEQLQDTVKVLGASRAQIVRADALEWLRTANVQIFDLVFLDPPYASALLAPACSLLNERGWLRGDASVYLEAPAEVDVSFLPADWRVVRSKQAGQVGYHLARVAVPTAPT